MSATGGSSMQQPNNNSEAVRRCLTVPNGIPSSQLRFQPHPPFATSTNKQRPRPYSAPARKKDENYTVPWRGVKYSEPKNQTRYYNVSLINHRPVESDVSRHAPYAARKMEAFVNSTLGYPRVENGQSIPIPSYDPLNDPHLSEYFERRFNSIQLEELRRQRLQRLRRPYSADSYGGLLSKRRRLDKKEDVLYKVAVTTGTLANCGTDAKVFIKMKGLKGKIPKTRLTKKAGSVKSGKKVAFRFAKGSTHVFKIWGPSIGDLRSLTVETSAIKKEEAWYLQEIEVINTKTKKTWHFFCNQWFSLYHGDGQVSRELYPAQSSKTEYEVTTVTGERAGAGTNANVFMTLYGKSGVTRKLHLKNTSKTLFENGSTDTFRFKSNSVGPMTKLRIEHDNTGFAAGWYLERVVVTDLNNPHWKYFFPCGQWLAKDEGDGEICRDLLGSRDPLAMRKACKYKVTIKTGDKKGAGTDANVFITMFGEFGDSGEKKLTKRGTNCFERNKTDEFILQCPKLGRLERVRIGHDNSGLGPGWYLDKVIVDDLEMNTVFEFPCQRWLDKSEDDGKITRELIVNLGPRDMSLGYPYVISVKTGDKQNAGTDARVYIIMYGQGQKETETSGKIWLETGGDDFERNKTDVFTVDVAKMISPLGKIEIGHDDSGAGPGWFLDSVTVYCPASGYEQYFPCNKWLATDEGDGLIQRTLYELKANRVIKEKQVNWQAWVFTSDIKFAGTDANVFITIYGDKGKSDDIPLVNKGDSFEKGNLDTFRFNTANIGKPYKMRVWHDNTGAGPGWHLDKIELESMEGKERFSFKCGRWLADNEDDKEIVREMPAESASIKKTLPLKTYVVQVYTGKKAYAGTDANVYINISGDLGDTGNRFLKYSKTNKNKFEKGNMDEFEIEAVTLHKLRTIRIGHDGHGAGAGWYLDKVVIFPKDSSDKEVVFPCDRWLAEDEDDGKIEREIKCGGGQMLNTTTFHVSVKTGDVRGAGTDSNVFLKIFGSQGDTGSIQLRQSESGGNKFEKAKTDVFKLEASDIGKIKKIKIGHDNSKVGAAWFLDEVVIDVPSKGEHYRFACHRWLSDKEGDKALEVELMPSDTKNIEKTIPYEITIWTGNKSGAGTDSNVFLQMYGKDGKTQEITLGNKTDNFEKGQIDKFKIEAPDVGQLNKVRIGHDGTGLMSGWFLEKMLIQRLLPPKKRAKKKMSEEMRRKSVLAMHLSDEDSSGGRSFRGSKSKLASVMEEDEDEDTEDYWFFVDQWFARSEGDKATVRELIPTDKDGKPLKGALEELEYIVRVFTGDERYAGTDANVFVNIYGEKGDTGERHLTDSETNTNKFERNKVDVFKVKAMDLGKLNKLNIRHDNKGGGADWFLDRVEVEDPKRKIEYFFPCQRWLATSKDDGQLTRELVPVDVALKKKLTKRDSVTAIRDEIGLEQKAAMTTYHVKVYTGDVWGAGTNANVYIVLFGEKDHTGKMFLKSSATNKDKFERNQMDEFLLELVNIGELKKIKIGHDNKGGGGAWFLDKVEIDAPSLGKLWTFPCGHWLSDSNEDRLLERELYPQELATEEYTPCIPYEITTYTSDISGAGTDAMVYIVLYGKETATLQKNLCTSKRECKQKFKRGTADKFVVEMEDVGDTIEKIRIGHDDAGFGAAWHLDKVEIRRLHNTGKNTLGSLTYTFPCKRWLARNEEDGAIERELLPERATQEIVGRDGETKTKELKIRDKLSAKKYTVEVFTGDQKGAGTDANVFLTIFGDRGDSGERQLRNSETNFDKFERNKMDRFVLEAVDLGRLYKVKVRHDNSKIGPAWYLDHIEVSDGEDKYVFHCERWLAKNKDDGKIERSLYVKGYDGDMSSTSTLRSTRFGGSTTSLDSWKTTSFSQSPRLSRSGKQLMQSLENVPEGPTIPYTIKVCTGDGEDNGTASNVWIKIYGPKKKHTGRLFLELVQKEKFEPSSIEIFSLEAVDVGEVKRVEIGHDGVSPGSGWFLKDMELDLPTKGKHYHFECRQWLAKDKGDGRTAKIFNVDDGLSSITSYKPMIPYEVKVITGDVADAGTDSKILLTVFGLKGTSSTIPMEKKEDRFERARTDLIKMEIDDVAPVKKVRLELDGKGSRPSWFLEKLELRNMETGNLSVFKYNGWIGEGKEGAKNPVDIAATERGKLMLDKISYKVKVKTSDVSGAGTDANVYIIIFGALGDTGEVHLKKSETNKSPFQKGQVDEFSLKDIFSLGELSKVRVWHDNKGIGAAWHLAQIEVEDLSTRKVFTFHCDKWLSKKDDDKQIIRELTCLQSARPGSASSADREKTNYEIEVTTTDKKEGGTNQNAWIILEGKKKSSKMIQLVNSAHNKILRKGTTNKIPVTSPNLGKLERCLVGAYEREDHPIENPEGKEAMWHCHVIVVTDIASGNRYTFPCQKWIKIHPNINKRDCEVLEIGKVEESQVAVQRNLAPVKYEIVVVTGDVSGAGTNANVFITIFGTNGNTGKRPLTKAFRDLFERNQTDKFQIEALDLGELTKVKIEHDNSGFRPHWFLEKVEVINMGTNLTTTFLCSKWLAKNKGDGEIARELFAKVD